MRRRPVTSAEVRTADRFWKWLSEARGSPPPENENAAAGGAATAQGTKNRTDGDHLTAAKDPAQERSVTYMRRLYRLAKSPGYQRAIFYWLGRHMNPQPLRRRG